LLGWLCEYRSFILRCCLGALCPFLSTDGAEGASAPGALGVDVPYDPGCSNGIICWMKKCCRNYQAQQQELEPFGRRPGHSAAKRTEKYLSRVVSISSVHTRTVPHQRSESCNRGTGTNKRTNGRNQPQPVDSKGIKTALCTLLRSVTWRSVIWMCEWHGKRWAACLRAQVAEACPRYRAP
jgi:hypothetical protein